MRVNVERVDGPRLLLRMATVGRVGADAAGGVTRLAFDAEHRRAVAVTQQMMRDAGLDAEIDAAGNLVGRSSPDAGCQPTIVLGSHLDTVVHGGRFDGAYGVLAAVEVLHTIRDGAVVLRHPVAVVAFADEEGSFWPGGMWGSRAIAGQVSAGALGGSVRGQPRTALLAAAGGSSDRLEQARWGPGAVAAYLELHVEQGREMDDSGHSIGVVDAIMGRALFDVTLCGVANHAGSTAMSCRQDALVAASQLVLAVRAVAEEAGAWSMTVGTIHVEPNMRNVVPGLVTLGVEVRDCDPAVLARAGVLLEDAAHRVTDETSVATDVATVQVTDPVPMDGDLGGAVHGAATRLGLPARTITSRAGHDAQVMASLGPAAMIFVPSRGGVSHAPQEHTDDTQLVAGADVLLHTLLAVDAREDAMGTGVSRGQE